MPELPRRPARRPSAAVVLATLALAVAAGPPAYSAARTLAAGSVGTTQLKDNAVTSPKVKNGTLTRSDLATSARAQRIVVGRIDSDNRGSANQDPIPAGGVVGSLGGRFGSGLMTLPGPGKIVVNGYVDLENLNPDSPSGSCDVLVDGVRSGGSTEVFLHLDHPASFPVEAVATVTAGSHDVAIRCSADANFVDLGVDVIGIAS